jgi:uncharacterized protein (TIGR03437 family)
MRQTSQRSCLRRGTARLPLTPATRIISRPVLVAQNLSSPRRFLRLIVAITSIATSLLAQPGTGPVIEQRLSDLKHSPALVPLPEVTDDFSAVPEDWLAVLCWNIQVGGTSPSPTALRPPLVQRALARILSGSYDLLAAQEVSGTANAEKLASQLPGGPQDWSFSFVDTTDRQDNGFWYQSRVMISEARPLFVSTMMDASGRLVTDPSLAVHPPYAAHFVVGDFDFTLVTLHLTFAGGDTSESVRELRVLLDYLDLYFQQPEHDPDVIVCGDFNTPSLLSGQSGSGGLIVDSVFDDDPRFQTGERRFVVAVHEPTSRTTVGNGGLPLNNYDHFVLSADVMEELVQARRLAPEVLTDDPADPEDRLTSDHYPTIAFFRTTGEDVSRDTALEPLITAVVNAADSRPGISTGSWVTIYGRDLAPTARSWRTEEIVKGAFPTELDGVRVTINGRPASVNYISPTQLNVQAADDATLGSVDVKVTRSGIESAPFDAELQTAAPAFFVFPQEAGRYVAAVHLDGTLVGRPSLFSPKVTSRPARAGEVVSLFGNAFGPTDPPVASGQVFVGAAPLLGSVSVTIGNIAAQVSFAGLSGAGLHQFNVEIPKALPEGDWTVIAETAGATTQENVFLTVE